jgi:hypothetical protein
MEMSKMDNTYTLLVWELVPEDTDLYLIPNEIADQYREYFVAAHNKQINCDDMNDGLRFLNTALGEDTAEENFEDYLGLFVEYKQKKSVPLTNQLITNVYLSGFVL